MSISECEKLVEVNQKQFDRGREDVVEHLNKLQKMLDKHILQIDSIISDSASKLSETQELPV